MSTDFHNEIADMTIASIVKPAGVYLGYVKMLIMTQFFLFEFKGFKHLIF